MAYTLSIQEYTELFNGIYADLGGKENLPASYTVFVDNLDASDMEMEDDAAMLLFASAYRDICKQCNHTLKHTMKRLRAMYPQDYRKTAEIIIWHGGHCDCEVIMNMSPLDYEQQRYEPLGYDMSAWEFNRLIDAYIAGCVSRVKRSTVETGIQQPSLWT